MFFFSELDGNKKEPISLKSLGGETPMGWEKTLLNIWEHVRYQLIPTRFVVIPLWWFNRYSLNGQHQEGFLAFGWPIPLEGYDWYDNHVASPAPGDPEATSLPRPKAVLGPRSRRSQVAELQPGKGLIFLYRSWDLVDLVGLLWI